MMSYMEHMEREQDKKFEGNQYFSQQFEVQFRNLEGRWKKLDSRIYLDLKFTLDFKWELYVNGMSGEYRLFSEVTTVNLIQMLEHELIVRPLRELKDIVANRLS